MPIYEYSCQGCQKDFEALIRGSETPKCPSCGSKHLEKLLSVPAAHSASSGDLSICQPPSGGGCGLPQCGMGGCQMDR